VAAGKHVSSSEKYQHKNENPVLNFFNLHSSVEQPKDKKEEKPNQEAK
jgi:hypothetical protein